MSFFTFHNFDVTVPLSMQYTWNPIDSIQSQYNYKPHTLLADTFSGRIFHDFSNFNHFSSSFILEKVQFRHFRRFLLQNCKALYLSKVLPSITFHFLSLSIELVTTISAIFFYAIVIEMKRASTQEALKAKTCIVIDIGNTVNV